MRLTVRPHLAEDLFQETLGAAELATAAAPDESVDTGRRAARVMACFPALPVAHREILLLAVQAGLETRDMAAVLGPREEAVRKRSTARPHSAPRVRAKRSDPPAADCKYRGPTVRRCLLATSDRALICSDSSPTVRRRCERTGQLGRFEIVARAVSHPAGLVEGLGEPKLAGIQRLHHTADLTILNVIWGAGMSLMPHDHRMWAVIGIWSSARFRLASGWADIPW